MPLAKTFKTMQELGEHLLKKKSKSIEIIKIEEYKGGGKIVYK